MDLTCLYNNTNLIKNTYYPTITNVTDYLIDFCKKSNYKNILEIGPGNLKFPIANKFVGYNEKIENYINIDRYR